MKCYTREKGFLLFLTILSAAAGRSFGELALINADCVRNASIIADETTDLIVVNRALYNRSLKVKYGHVFNLIAAFK